MKVVLDTNIIVAALSRHSPYNWVIQGFLKQQFHIVVSHEILLEYEEILRVKYNPQTVEYFLSALHEAENCHEIQTYYHWPILDDPDDNKFVNAAISSGADFIVSEDKAFRKLRDIDFPEVNVLRMNEFEQLLKNT